MLLNPAALGSVSPAKHHWVALHACCSRRCPAQGGPKGQHRGACYSPSLLPIRTTSASVNFLKSLPRARSVLLFIGWVMLLGLESHCAWACNAEEGRVTAVRSL